MRGRVFELVEQAVVALLGLQLRDPARSESLMSPNTIASAGQACWQAVTISPSPNRPVLLLRVDARVR